VHTQKIKGDTKFCKAYFGNQKLIGKLSGEITVVNAFKNSIS